MLALLALTALTISCSPQVADTFVVSDDAELRALATELLPDLTARSGLELKAPVRLARRSRPELVAYLTRKLDQEMPAAEARDITESYRLLGLVPEGLDLRALLLSVYTEQVAGFYDPDSTALFVMDDQPTESLRTVLIHELVHAVQDQHVDLDSLTARARGNDRQMAAQAAIEGHATLVMIEYAASQQMGRRVDLTEIPEISAQMRPDLESLREQYPAVASAPAIIQETLLFPYLEGTGWVLRLWHDAGARPSPLSELLPQSTEQVIGEGPSLPPGRDEPTEVGLGVAGARYSNTLGEMETGVLLRQLVGPAAATAARGWDGDRFALVDAAGGPGLVWLTVWDDGAARDLFVATLRPGLARLPGPATLEPTDADGRPGALLRVGTRADVTVTLSGGRP
ncbi:MAG: hypothetical protein EXR95_07615 [Gemmatimonadetes bacterium]|nr:hypothetical protein [Gemmatimonadota bacterium]